MNPMNPSNEFNENFISEHLDPLSSHTSDFPFHELDGEQGNADCTDFSAVGDMLRNLFRWMVEPLSTHGGREAQKLIAERVLALATATTPELFEANQELLRLAAQILPPYAIHKTSLFSEITMQGSEHRRPRVPKVQNLDVAASQHAEHALLRGFRSGFQHTAPSTQQNPSKAQP